MKKEDSAYIREEERKEFQQSIGQYIHQKQTDTSPQDKHQYVSNVFIADVNIKVDLKLNPHQDDEFKRPGLQSTKMGKLKSGKFGLNVPCLDMHGMQLAEAGAALAELINHSHYAGNECVKIIHGKGLNLGKQKDHVERDNLSFTSNRANNIGKLKLYVLAWLKDNPVVMGFCRALPQDGGGGATYALLKKQSLEE